MLIISLNKASQLLTVTQYFYFNDLSFALVPNKVMFSKRST